MITAALVKPLLTSLRPRSLLEVSLSPSEELEQFCHDHNICHRHCLPENCVSVTERYEMALVHNVGNCPTEQLRQTLGLLKNLLSERVWLLIDEDLGTHNTWISLGFKRDELPGAASEPSMASYSYNLDTYNHKRDWNNPRFWANPEHWDKRF